LGALLRRRLTYYGGFLGASVAAWYLLPPIASRSGKPRTWLDWSSRSVSVLAGWGVYSPAVASESPRIRALVWSFRPNSPASESEFKAGLLKSMSGIVAQHSPDSDLRIRRLLRDRGAAHSVRPRQKTLRRPGLPGVRRAVRGGAFLGWNSCVATTAAG